MKLKRGIALLLAAVFLFGTLAVPASAAAAQPEPAAQAQTVDAEENDIISVRIKASGELTYGADHKLEIQTTPADAQYIFEHTEGIAGFFGASSIERLAVEPAIEAARLST